MLNYLLTKKRLNSDDLLTVAKLLGYTDLTLIKESSANVTLQTSEGTFRAYNMRDCALQLNGYYHTKTGEQK